MKNLVLITGLPRSGTSMVAGVFAICGAWVGKTAPGGQWNAKGSNENMLVREHVLKALLDLMGMDPLGLSKLPPVGAPAIVDPKVFRDRVTNTFVRQGWSNGIPVIYKDAKLALCYQQWRESFPEAKWVVVRRPERDVIASCLRAEPMTRRMGLEYEIWRDWHHKYTELVNQVEATEVVDVVQDVWKGDRLKDIIGKFPGLVWREREVREWIEPDLWHGRN